MLKDYLEEEFEVYMHFSCSVVTRTDDLLSMQAMQILTLIFDLFYNRCSTLPCLCGTQLSTGTFGKSCNRLPTLHRCHIGSLITFLQFQWNQLTLVFETWWLRLIPSWRAVRIFIRFWVITKKVKKWLERGTQCCFHSFNERKKNLRNLYNRETWPLAWNNSSINASFLFTSTCYHIIENIKSQIF